jgi:hypothetical protein
MPDIKTGKLTDLTQDPNNANRGTERGADMVRRSLEKLGAGRSVLVDKNGVLLAGNKSCQAAVDIGLEDTIIVPTDGTKLVVVQRTDLDLATDAKAKELAIADNRASEVGLEWDTGVLEDLAQDVELADWFTEDEMAGWDVGVEDDGIDYQPPEDQGFDEDDIPESSVRMVQLFLDTDTQPLFLEMVENLNLLYGTDNPTDCVMAGLRELCQNHAIVLEDG